MQRIITVLLLLLFVPSGMQAENSDLESECKIIDDFAQGLKPGWKTKSFKGMTEYTWTKENNKGYVMATSKGTASGLYYETEYDPELYPYITWQWKVDRTVTGGDATKKSCDDYGARIYVVFPSLFFWKTKTINYIWGNSLPKGQTVPSPYTANDIMICVQSGSTHTGKWLVETRNIYEDFKRVFGEDPPKVGAIAIMTDTDDTGESVSAGYGPIAVCSRDPRK